jgi:Domain of unknown function (DUF4157)
MSVSAELASSSKESEPQAQAATPSIAPAEGFSAPFADVGFAIPPVDPSTLATIYRQPLKHSVNASVRAATFRRTQQLHGNSIVQRVLARSAAPPSTRVVQRKCACGGTCEDCRQSGNAPDVTTPVVEPAIESKEARGVIQRQPLDLGPPPPDRPLRPHVPQAPRAAGQGATVNIPPASPGSTCFTGDVCSNPIPGSATRFATHVDEQLKKAPKNPARPVASAVITFANAESPGLIAGVTVVVNPNLGSTSAGGQADVDKKKVEVTSAFEAEAAQFNAVPRIDNIGGRSRAEWRLNGLRVLTHEMSHIRFATSPPSGLPALDPTATAELDELNAILSEFPFTFARAQLVELDAEAQTAEIQRVVRNYIERRGEGIRGILTSLRCSASCADADSAVRRVFEAQSASWPSEYRDTVLTVLANPSVRLQWPMPPPPRPGLSPVPRSAGMGGIQRHTSGPDATRSEAGDAHEAASRMMAASQAQPLDPSALSAMEAGFGRDLSDVRVHTDAPAANAAAMLDAAAFTTGRDIYFSESRFAPSTDEGQHLLAHEIAHTIQQSDGIAPPGVAARTPFVVAPADDPLESEADRAAEQVTVVARSSTQSAREVHRGGRTIPGTAAEAASDRVIQRQEEPSAAGMTSPDAPVSIAAPIATRDPTAIDFEGRRLRTSRAALRSELVAIIAESGYAAARLFVQRLNATLPRRFCNPMTQSCRDVPGRGPSSTPEGASLVRDIATVMDEELRAIRTEHDAFVRTVKSAAQVRLEGNRQALAQWKTFITESLTPQQVRDEMLAQSLRDLSMRAIHHPNQGIAMQSLESAVTTHSPAYQRTNVAVIRREINSGCQFCHQLQSEIHRDYQTTGGGRAPSMLELLQESSGAATSGPAFSTNRGEGEGIPPWAFTHSQGLPGVTEAWRQIDRIRPYMRALGDNGYRVIPDAAIETSRSPAEVVARASEHIDARRARLEGVKRRVGEPDFDYLMLEAVLDSLLILQPEAVRAMVASDRRERARRAQEEAAITMVIAGISLLLVIFPPTSGLGLAIGAGLAVHGIAQGVGEVQQGLMLASARGAHDVFTPEQQAAADQLMVSGLFTIALNAAALGLSGLQAVKMVRAGGQGARAITSVEGRVGDDLVRITEIESGNPLITVRRADGTLETIRMPPGGAPTGGGPGVPFEGRWPLVRQTGEYWCGAACGEMAAQRLGVQVSQEELAASRLFQEPVIVNDKVVRVGGFQSTPLGQALEEAAPVAGRKWVGGLPRAGEEMRQSAAGLERGLRGFLRSSDSSIVLRVRGGEHWVVVDEITAEGLIVVRDPARQATVAMTAEELHSMVPTGEVVISFPSGR